MATAREAPSSRKLDAQSPFGPGGPFQGARIRSRRAGRVRRGDVRLAILALLLQEPLNGYQIIQKVSERTDGAWRPSPGAVYPALSQLEDECLVEAFDNDGQKAFRLTEAGTHRRRRRGPQAVGAGERLGRDGIGGRDRPVA